MDVNVEAAGVHGHVGNDGQGGQMQQHIDMHYIEDDGNQSNDQVGDDAGVDAGAGADDCVAADPANQSDDIALRYQGGSQLTLTFQGEVYVFDCVSAEKVQAVLLLLGGREVPAGLPSVPLRNHPNNRGSANFPERVVSLTRFREKRKERNFDKKIRYNVRKEVARRMQRYKGRFASAKKISEAAMTIAVWDASEGPPQQETACRHCGISGESTPMMRRGPEGPKTLCNACGLMWANKGTLKDLSRPGAIPYRNPPPNLNENETSDGDLLQGDPDITIIQNGHET